MSHILHYVVARGIFDMLRAHGAPIVGLVLLAGALLLIKRRR